MIMDKFLSITGATMGSIFRNNTEDKIMQQQSLHIQSKLIAFVQETLVYDSGYVVLEIKDEETFELDFYYSTQEMIPRYDETRDETIERILFTLECGVLNSNSNIPEIISSLYYIVVGKLYSRIIDDKFSIIDRTEIFQS